MPDPQQELELGQARERDGDLAAAAAHYRAAAEHPGADAELGAEGLRRAAVMLHLQSDFDGALETARRSASVAEDAGLRDAYGAALNVEGIVHMARAEFPQARRTFEQVLAIAAGDRVRGIALQNLGAIAAQTGSWDVARRRFEQSRVCFQRAGYALGEAMAVGNYGRAALDHASYALAAELLEEALAFAMRHGDATTQAMTNLNLAEAVLHLGRVEEAERRANEALAVFDTTGNTWRRVEALRILGDVAETSGEIGRAVARWSEGLGLAEKIGAPLEVAKLRSRIRESV